MRKATLGFGLAIALALAARAHAGTSSQTINVQGVLRDATGSLQSMAVGLVVSLYTTESGGAPFYKQVYATVAVDNGFFSVELSDPALSFAGMNDAWIGVQVTGDPTELPRQHLGATPFAFSAATLSGVLPVANGGTGATEKNFVDLSSDQANIGGNKTFTGLVSSARGADGTPRRVCSGSTPIGSTAWSVYNANGVTVKVDTSGCGFTSTPHYVSSLGCSNVCWQTTGGNNPYKATATGFDIYVYYIPGPFTPAQANESGFHIEWIAVGN
jgi:hypothetical protein